MAGSGMEEMRKSKKKNFILIHFNLKI
jgi:hypothetical protein